MHRVFHFEINSDDPEKCCAFYSDVFGWTVHKKATGDEDYWFLYTGRSDETGINGAVKKRVTEQPTVANTIEVPSIDEFIKKIKKHGGKVLIPKTSVTKTGYIAYCADPEGITFSILEKDNTVE